MAPTVGFEISTLDRGGPRVHLWDVGGQRTLRPFWRNYFEATDGLVWVVDAGDRARLAVAAAELAALLSEARLASAALLVLANKQDVAGAATAAEVAAALGLGGGGRDGDGAGAHPSLSDRPWRVAPASALAGAADVRAAFDWLLAAVASRDGGGVGAGGGGEGEGEPVAA